MKFEQKRKYFIGLIIALVLGVVFVVIRYLNIERMNNTDYVTYGCDESSDAYIDFGNRQDATSSWEKKDFDLYGKTVDLQAQTIDGVVTNNSNYEIRDWYFVVNVHKDCFINQAWCGTVEIHQNVKDKKGKIQTLDLRNYDLDSVKLEYLYDGDLLIPLHEGDYFIYYPSVNDNEAPVLKDSTVGLGGIFYYLEPLDFSDTEFHYFLHRSMKDGIGFYLIFAYAFVWLVAVIMYYFMIVIYRRAEREMKIRKQGIASMSGIYDVIYIVDLDKNELIPVMNDDENEQISAETAVASDVMRDDFAEAATDAYKELVESFVDLSTIRDRIEGKSNIVCEYLGVNRGWCRMRFFSVNKNAEASNIHKVLFALQVINEEKRQIDEIEGRVTRAESESKSKSTFLANMSHEIRTPINTVLGLDTMILRESTEKNIKAYARDIIYAENNICSCQNVWMVRVLFL